MDRANGTRANGHRANGNRADDVAPYDVFSHRANEVQRRLNIEQMTYRGNDLIEQMELEQMAIEQMEIEQMTQRHLNL